MQTKKQVNEQSERANERVKFEWEVRGLIARREGLNRCVYPVHPIQGNYCTERNKVSELQTDMLWHYALPLELSLSYFQFPMYTFLLKHNCSHL